ncbi:ABC transporter ATP-binding protein [Agrobacterium vitis]|uniref:ATP-binding cassette domain-containing protein n=1 Tax=Agrobacterium vitis TaxID=373 RepID=UPI000872FD07|nr:ATP-binding cassette domain-containing protein [Agrobacterium vitis]MCE6075915.1 ATP-binding cassette domain-containing protein [Agrobacterium vitis]MCF1465784.1 ABC transporter ATP-binding protein [Agrobacterium vitis]MCM2452876.1 ABC transporter ATP-binding protein [Agrobacterium vitis]MCM2468395.1 ABC transporter ATP-binding protein [Agrobacterium vitis]MUO70614.1 ATP-binding cassette domain-containing protein [Agrobacterium vitis]
MTTEPILALENIRKVFSANGREVRALNGVSLSLGRGETLGVIGESGSGKSTLGRIAVGLETASKGTIRIGGTDIAGLSVPLRREAFRHCQMIFQDPYSSLNPRLKIGRQIGEGIYATGIANWKEIGESVADLLEKVGLKRDYADRYPHEFSGGQRQRIAIARALAPGPQVVIADEPVSALDVSIQAQILDLLADLQKENFLSYLFISHDMAVVAHLCDRVAVMHHGRIVEYGPVEAIVEHAQHPYTKSLLEAVPRLGRRRSGERRVPVALPTHGDDDPYEAVSPGHWVLAHSHL